MLRAFCGTCAVLALLCGVGCGPKQTPRVEVKGKISYQGKPLTAGSVTFISGNDVGSGAIANGEYSIPDAPVGDVQISIVTPAATMAPQQMKQKVEGKSFSATDAPVVPVPPNFNDPATSGLKYTVKPDPMQTYDIVIP